MAAKWQRRILSVLVPSTLAIGVFNGVQKAGAAEFLWISAPNWSYSAAAAASPVGSIYFWGLSVGSGSFSWAYAFSNDGAGNAAYAYAEASANGRGGLGGVNVAGLADPYAGVSIDTGLLDPSNPTAFPGTEPGSNPFSSAYSVSSSGITFSGSGSELNGADAIQAFLYTGGTDETSLDADLGVTNTENGTTSSGDVTDMSTLMTDFGLVPLDAPDGDPSSLSSLNFTENDSSVNPADVILVGEGEADSVPEPASADLLAAGLLGLLPRRRRIMP